jgi:hypothetical protein
MVLKVLEELTTLLMPWDHKSKIFSHGSRKIPNNKEMLKLY